MTAKNLSVLGKLTDYDPKQPERDYQCGNNKFSENIWDFKGFLDKPTWNDKKFQLNFTVFYSNSIRNSVKHYIASELLMNGFNSVRRKLDSFKQLRDFIEIHEIKSLRELNKTVLKEYFEYVLSSTNVKGLPLSAVSRKKAAQVVQELLIRGSIRGWEVPKESKHVKSMYQIMIIENKGIKEGTKFGKTNKVLPSNVIIDNLISISNESLKKNEDVLTAASILLTTQLGPRINEFLSIKTNCIKTINGVAHLLLTTTKVDKSPVEVFLPANEIVVKTIDYLEKYAEPLRIESGLPYLFLTRNRNQKGFPICIASFSNWTKNRLKPFIEKHDIRDEYGKALKLTSHYFRHVFATYALKGGMKIHDVAEILNHKSLSMTETYDHSSEEKQEVVKEILSGEVPVTSTNKVVLESLEGDQNPFKGLTTENVDKMRRALKIELLPHGMCLHHPMRGEPCAQDGACLGCTNFLASSKHLPIYEKRLDKVNQELQSQRNGEGIYSTKLQYQKGKLEKYILELQKKMAKKEFREAMLEVAVARDE
ncbi:tyrosine-type recombinase/integrase [Sutcliffiella sp. NC1]|uniref:tyrosine-type recombinase/integrase n=1 Tax=Sutcliffiella sp. NC1 TaxID=3004096 RepID=UPI0022DD46DE|nr:tyrosine-type recombinase/integrase [Sutcliffiella sp. NC1]WBL15106.1 tyrosine-type recombinase/integrase [Sutcliffiella sp. NC1]